MEVRWQLIRSFETSMLAENENLGLRKQIDNLRTAHKAQNRVTGDKLREFTSNFSKEVVNLREELDRTKKDYNDAQKDMLRQMDMMKNKLIEVREESTSKTLEIFDFKEKIKELNELVATLRQEASEQAGIKAADADRNSRTIEMLRTELGEADTLNKFNLEKLENLDAQVKNEILNRDNLTEEVKRLRLWIGKMEENGLVAATEADEVRRKMELEHNMNMNALMEENNTLRATIVYLQEELTRAQNALNVPPTNSHFGKFVELKSENRKLQGKLENTLKAQVNSGPGSSSSSSSSTSSRTKMAANTQKGAARSRPPQGGSRGYQHDLGGGMPTMRTSSAGKGTDPQMSPRVAPPGTESLMMPPNMGIPTKATI